MRWQVGTWGRKQLAGFPQRLHDTIKFADGINGQVRMFAKRSGLGEGTLRRYLLGSRLPTLDRVFEIAAAGNVSVAWLVTGVGDPHADPETGGDLDLDLVRSAIIKVDSAVGTRMTSEAKAALVVDLLTMVHYRMGLTDAQKRKLLQEYFDSRDDV